MKRAERAIIVAAGKGKRMMPISEHTPKPLIPVFGEPIIEHTIKALKENGIDEIYIVVGYLKEKFEYLCDKYGVALIVNEDYENTNNISSLYAAREHIAGAVILDGDIWVSDASLFSREFESSGYISIWTDTHTDEWLQFTDGEDFVTSCSRNGGEGGWILYSISFWNDADAKRLKEDLETQYVKLGNRDIYWDDVPVFCYPGRYRLRIKKADKSAIREFDSISELAEFDTKYREYLNDRA